MSEYVLIEVSFEGYSRYLLENDILSISVFKKYESKLNEILSEVWYSDFNGKHGHVGGNYNVKYLSTEEARSYHLNGEINGLGKSFDSLLDELDSDIVDEISNDIETIERNFKMCNLLLTIDLSDAEDVILERSKVLDLLKNNGYKVLL